MSQRAADGPPAAQKDEQRRESLSEQPTRQHPTPEQSTPEQSTPEHPDREPHTRGAWSLLREVLGVLVTAILLSVLVKTFLLQAFFIPSGSMEPVLHGCPTCANGDRVVVNKLTSHMGGVQRGDIVVFKDSSGWLSHPMSRPGLRNRLHDALETIGVAPETSESHLVKRVIGVGGDTVEGRDGTVYVNGTRLIEPYVFAGNSPTDDAFRVTVPAGALWVMGDHRAESGDSRFHQQGPGKGFVPVKDVEGRAIAIVWPLDRVGTLGRPETFDRPFVATRH